MMVPRMGVPLVSLASHLDTESIRTWNLVPPLFSRHCDAQSGDSASKTCRHQIGLFLNPEVPRIAAFQRATRAIDGNSSPPNGRTTNALRSKGIGQTKSSE